MKAARMLLASGAASPKGRVIVPIRMFATMMIT